MRFSIFGSFPSRARKYILEKPLPYFVFKLYFHWEKIDLKVIHDRNSSNGFKHVPVYSKHLLITTFIKRSPFGVNVWCNHFGVDCVRKKIEPHDLANLH